MVDTTQHGRRSTPVRRVLAASFVGTTIEWYDYFLFGSAAALIFPSVFFPTFDPVVGTLLAFLTFAVGFFARPLGGVVFGSLGDRIGRRWVLVVTLVLMGVSTALMGLLPDYATIGIWAPVLLVLLRMLQGFGAGAEYGGAVLMAAEHAPPERRGLYASVPAIAISVGLMLATGALALVRLLSAPDLASWGWRLPFLASIVMVGVGLYVRLRVPETPDFERLRTSGAGAHRPVRELLRTHRRPLVVAVGARFGQDGNAYILITFSLAYLARTDPESGNIGLYGVLVASAVGCLTTPLFGALSDRVGRRPVYLGGGVVVALGAVPFFWALGTGSTPVILLAYVLVYAVGVYAMLSPQGAYLAELFDARVRFSGIALARELSSPLAGGLAAFVAAGLFAWTGSFWAVAAYMMGMAAVSVVAVAVGPETRPRPGRSAEPAPGAPA